MRLEKISVVIIVSFSILLCGLLFFLQLFLGTRGDYDYLFLPVVGILYVSTFLFFRWSPKTGFLALARKLLLWINLLIICLILIFQLLILGIVVLGGI